MGNGKIIKLGFILLIIISLFISFACQSAEDDVDIGYEVTASASLCNVDIFHSDADGRIVQVPGETPPFNTSFIVPSDEVTGFLVFLMAQNCSEAEVGETITVTITKDGLLFLDDTGDGPFDVAFASGKL